VIVDPMDRLRVGVAAPLPPTRADMNRILAEAGGAIDSGMLSLAHPRTIKLAWLISGLRPRAANRVHLYG
jgi:hypothetical protein